MPIPVSTPESGFTFREMQDEVLDHGFDTTAYRTRVKRWLNEGVHRIRSIARGGNADAAATLSTVAATAAYDLPAASLRVRSVRYADASGQLESVEIEDADATTESAKPSGYALFANRIVLTPTPDAVYELEVRFFGDADEMVDDDDVPGLPDRWRGVPISYALGKAFGAEDDPEMATYHRGEYERDLGLLRADLQMGRTSNKQIPGMYASAAAAPRFQRPA